MLGILERWAGWVKSMGTNNMGQWSWVDLRGKKGKPAKVISAYRVYQCTPKSRYKYNTRCRCRYRYMYRFMCRCIYICRCLSGCRCMCMFRCRCMSRSWRLSWRTQD